jgi:hypothetical protein
MTSHGTRFVAQSLLDDANGTLETLEKRVKALEDAKRSSSSRSVITLGGDRVHHVPQARSGAYIQSLC